MVVEAEVDESAEVDGGDPEVEAGLVAGDAAVADAAVAVGFAEAVTLPRAGNLGGGGFMMIALGDGSVLDGSVDAAFTFAADLHQTHADLEPASVGDSPTTTSPACPARHTSTAMTFGSTCASPSGPRIRFSAGRTSRSPITNPRCNCSGVSIPPVLPQTQLYPPRSAATRRSARSGAERGYECGVTQPSGVSRTIPVRKHAAGGHGR